MFGRVRNWNSFQGSDIELSEVRIAGQSQSSSLSELGRKLDSKPALVADVHQFPDLSPSLPADRYPDVRHFFDFSVCFPHLMVSVDEHGLPSMLYAIPRPGLHILGLARSDHRRHRVQSPAR